MSSFTDSLPRQPKGESVEVCNPLPLEPLLRDLYLEPPKAYGAPDPLAPLARDVLVVLVKVELHRESAAFETRHRALHVLISRSKSGK